MRIDSNIPADAPWRRAAFLLVFLGATAFAHLHRLVAQSAEPQPTQVVLAIRVFDGRTGHAVSPSSILVRVDHRTEHHPEWVKLGADGKATLSLPVGAKEIFLEATYDQAMSYYHNCDVAQPAERGDAPPPLAWYPVSTILGQGIATPNYCVGRHVPERLQIVANPGEIVFFVRKLSAAEQLD